MTRATALGNAAQQVTSPCGKDMKMKYVSTKSGMVLTEEELEEIYRLMNTLSVINETNYKAWKFDMLAAGKMKFAE